MSKQLIDVVMEMKQELQEVYASLSIYLNTKISSKTKSEIIVLQDRLEFRMLKYEEQILKEKIQIYKEALKLAKNDSKKPHLII